jgi:ribosomal protein S21
MQRASFRPRQQCRPSPQGAEEEDAARRRFREMKLRGHYEKPSEKRIPEKAEAIRRARKLARKKLQREGLLPMKPRTIPGQGRGGRPRAPRF